jgi:hypothetical protein
LLWEEKDAGASVDLAVEQEVLGDARRPVAVLVDLVPTKPPTDAFGEYLISRPNEYSVSLKLRPAQPRKLLPEEIAGTVARVAAAIRECASQQDTHEVHLFLRTSFPIAVLLGRLFNTLRVTLYELEDAGDRPGYIPVITVSSGRGGGPIVTIF